MSRHTSWRAGRQAGAVTPAATAVELGGCVLPTLLRALALVPLHKSPPHLVPVS